MTDPVETPMRPAVTAAVELVAGGGTLPAPLAEAAMEELMDGAASPVQVAALLGMLRVRGETPEEVAAFARVMRARAVHVEAPEDAVDLCGTGADGLHTFNISTIAAFVVAGAGAPVAKHGNRAVTSRSGSADLIEALDITLDPGPEVVARSIRETGFGFMFAPAYHPAMKHAMPIRRDLPMRTVFNLLGPISSPARVRRQLLGVADPRLVPLIAGALSRLETRRAIVVHGADGSDELSLAGANHALLVEDGRRVRAGDRRRGPWPGARVARRPRRRRRPAELRDRPLRARWRAGRAARRRAPQRGGGAVRRRSRRRCRRGRSTAAADAIDSGRAADVVTAAAGMA